MKLKSLILLILINMSSCYAQQVISETNLFEWANGSVIQKPMFIEIDRQPSEDVLSSHTFPIYHSFSINTSSNNYRCNIQIIGGEGETENDNHLYEQISIVDNHDTVLLKRFGYDYLTTTRWLSGDDNDTNYFRKIDLNEDCFALIFAGWFFGYGSESGEMIIVIVNKNVATLVYDDYALATTATDFTSSNFSMDFVKNGAEFINSDTGLLDLTSANLAGRTKYTLYKEGDMLKIREWR